MEFAFDIDWVMIKNNFEFIVQCYGVLLYKYKFGLKIKVVKTDNEWLINRRNLKSVFFIQILSRHTFC